MNDDTDDTLEAIETPRSNQLERYQIVGKEHHFMLGYMFSAKDRLLGCQALIKYVSRRNWNFYVFRRLLLKEVSLSQTLNHPSIIPAYSVHEEHDSIHVAYTHRTGCTLSILQSLHTNVFTLRSFIEIISKLCDSLHYLHQRNITLLELRPDNILVSEDGQPYFLDLTTATTNNSHFLSPKDEVDYTLKTLAYCSPEYIHGKPPYRITTTIWSIGVMLYQILYDAHPFPAGTEIARIAAILTREPEPQAHGARNAPALLARICFKCLSNSVHERYQSAADLAHDLRSWLNPEPLSFNHEIPIPKLEIEIRLEAVLLRKQLKVFYLVGRLHYKEGAISLNEAGRRLGERELAGYDDIKSSVPTITRYFKQLLPFFRNLFSNPNLRLVEVDETGGRASMFTQECRQSWLWTETYLKEDNEVGNDWWGISEQRITITPNDNH